MTNRQTKTLEASMKRLTVWTCLLLLALAGPAWSVPQIMTEYGDQTPWLGTDINAMGGTGAALYRGGMSNIFNPAFLAVEKSNRLDVGIVLDQEHEDRFVPLFDTFGSYVTDVSIASNRNHYWQTGFGLVLHDTHAGLPISIGLSLADRYPYSYTFEEEVRNPDPGNPPDNSIPRDAVIENRARKVTGTLRNASLGLGADMVDWLSVGAAVHYAFGTRTETNSQAFYYDYQSPLEGVDGKHEYDMSGINMTVGLRCRVSERIEIGLAYESPLTASGTADTTYGKYFTDSTPDSVWEASIPDSYYRYPQIFRGGFTFYPRTDPKTVFTAELEYIPWEKFESSLLTAAEEPTGLDKTLDVRIGLEHTFYNGVPLRFGFRHHNSYIDKDAGATIFTGGTGFPIGSGLVSFSVEIIKITSYQEHQFEYPEFPETYESPDEARVEDTRFRMAVGYTVNW
jgi:hypothetical protein